MIIPHFDVQSDLRIRVHHFTPNAKKDEPVIVMCHPTGFCALAFTSLVAHMRNLNVFAIDIRSHGYSERGDVSDWSVFAEDLDASFAEIKKITKHEKFVGVGISSGSSAHILNSQSNPELYSCLYLCEPILFPPDSDLSTRDMLAAMARKRRDKFESRDEAYFNYINKGGLSALSKSTLALFSTHGFKNTEEGIELRCSRTDEEAIYLSGAANKVFDALSDVKVKSQIVYGQHSPTMNEQSARLVASQMPDASIQELKDTGHFTLLEKPLRGAQSIQDFVATQDLETLRS